MTGSMCSPGMAQHIECDLRKTMETKMPQCTSLHQAVPGTSVEILSPLNIQAYLSKVSYIVMPWLYWAYQKTGPFQNS